MEKLNLSQQRDFSALFTATFSFFKQEFIPIVRSFSVIVLPLILLSMIFLGNMLKGSYALSTMQVEDIEDIEELIPFFVNTGFFFLIYLLLLVWLNLYAYAYIKVYQRHYREGEDTPITAKEILRTMISDLGRFVVWSLLYSLIVFAGSMCFLLPGIYLGIALSFGACFILLKEKSLSDSLSAAWDLIKEKWWMTFAFFLLFGLMIGIASSVFQLPFQVMNLTMIVTGESPNVYLLTLLLLIPMLIRYFLSLLLVFGKGVLFYSYAEEREHTTLLGRIESIGSDNDTAE